MHGPARRLTAAMVVTILIAGCDEPSPSTLATPAAVSSPSASPSATATPVPSPSAAPQATPTPTLAPWSPAWTVQPVAPRFDVVWNQVAGADVPTVGTKLLNVERDPSWVELNGTYVLTYEPESGSGPHLWHSTDLVHWDPAIPRESWQRRVHAGYVVRGGPGLVALGTDNLAGSGAPTKPAVWLSSDGGAWDRVPDEVVPPVQWLYGGPDGLVAFGAHTWTSTDGIAWHRVGPSPLKFARTTGFHVTTVLDVGNSALVFAAGGFEEGRLILVHRLDPNGQWQDLGEIPDSTGFSDAVLGPQGLVVLGSAVGEPRAAWRSVDAIEWQRATRPPRMGHLAATASGYVVVSARVYFEGCVGVIGGAQIPETWASADGLRWHRVADAGTQDHQELSALIGQGDALVAAGYTWPDAGFDGAAPTLWRAEIRPRDDAPVGTPVPEGGGCS